jgi:hypothetical protein
MDVYERWLKETHQVLYELEGTYWRLYRRALLPASLKPSPVKMAAGQAQELLAKSGALFLRYFTRFHQKPTEFWYVGCSEYKFENLSGNTKSKIRRAHKNCMVRRVDPDWLGRNGYECYTAALAKYPHNDEFYSQEKFLHIHREAMGGPFHFWGVFVEERLVAYAKCVNGEDYVSTLVLKFNPNHLRLYSAYALIDLLLQTYVREERKLLVNGFRSIAHDTQMQDFLLQFSFRRFYCDLQIVYPEWLRRTLTLTYPFRRVMDFIPSVAGTRQFKTLFAQEKIRRSFLGAGHIRAA